MTNKQRIQEFLKYVETRNTHQQKQLLFKMEELGLNKTQTWRDIKGGSYRVGKNTIKGIMLYNLIDNMKDQ